MMEIEVVDIRKAHGDGKLKAFANVKFGGSLIIRGFSVLDGVNGIFVKVPAKLAKDGRWIDMVAVDDFLKQGIEEKVLEAYDKETDGVTS